MTREIAEESVKTSVAMAMQNFLLAAHAKKLGMRVKDGIKFFVNHKDLKDKFYQEFSIPKEYRLTNPGYTKPAPKRPAFWKNRDLA